MQIGNIPPWQVTSPFYETPPLIAGGALSESVQSFIVVEG
jgi:hypothetical protein